MAKTDLEQFIWESINIPPGDHEMQIEEVTFETSSRGSPYFKIKLMDLEYTVFCMVLCQNYQLHMLLKSVMHHLKGLKVRVRVRELLGINNTKYVDANILEFL